jgi:bacterioferritin (cytochrome b1)
MDAGRNEALNGLLRAELSAADTYSRLPGISSEQSDGANEFRKIGEDHRESAQLLSAQIVELGGTAQEEASTWRNIKALVSLAPTAQDPTTIKALLEGEEQDLLTYQWALRHPQMDSELRELIERMLVPRTESHIKTLQQFLRAA